MLVRENFPLFHSRIMGLELSSRGRIQPTESSPTYRVEIRYSGRDRPDVRVLEPRIRFNPALHMYQDDTLCLYDWRENPWQTKWHLHETIIPWAAEWLVYYELWLLTGKWQGKSAAHGQNPVPAP